MADKDILRIFDIRGNNDEKNVACLKIFLNDKELFSEDVQDLYDTPEDASLCRDLSFFFSLKELFIKGLNIDINNVEVKEYSIQKEDDVFDFIWSFNIIDYIND